MNKVNPFPALTAPSPLILLLNSFIAFEVAFEAIFLTNPRNLSPAKVIVKFVTTFYLLYLTRNQEIKIQIHKKPEFHPLFRRYIFRKTTVGEGGGVNLTPSHPAVLGLNFEI